MATIVEGNPKALFLIATTPRCRGERFSFPWIVPLYSWSIPFNAECSARRHQVPFFWVFGMNRPGIEPGSPGPLANTLTIMPMSGLSCILFKIESLNNTVIFGNNLNMFASFNLKTSFFTLDPYLIILSVKKGGIKYHFLSFWYDSTWDWTPVSWNIGKYLILIFIRTDLNFVYFHILLFKLYPPMDIYDFP